MWAHCQKDDQVVQKLLICFDHLSDHSEAIKCCVNATLHPLILIVSFDRETILHIVCNLIEWTSFRQTSDDVEAFIVDKVHALPHLYDHMVWQIDASDILSLAFNVQDSLKEFNGCVLLHVVHVDYREAWILKFVVTTCLFLAQDQDKSQLSVVAELIDEIKKLAQ